MITIEPRVQYVTLLPNFGRTSMKRTAIAFSVSLMAVLPAAALAQTEHDAHHPAQSSALPEQAPVSPQPKPAMSGMTEEGGAMMQGMMAPPNPTDAASVSKELPDFTQAYLGAMDAMHAPMMKGIMADDADTAFVQGMIPHHQSAIDMAKVVQKYGDDPQTQEWAGQIIAAQEREIAEMKTWLKEKGGNAALNFGQTGGTTWSADEGGNALSAIDLATGSVSTVPLPISPHNVDLTPDGGSLLAVGTPASGDAATGGHDHADTAAAAGLLAVVDAEDLSKPAATVEVGSHPAHVVADREGRAFVSLSGDNEVAVVDLASLQVIDRIATGAAPHGLRLSPDGTELYVANVEDGSVSVIDTAGLTEAARIPVGEAPVQVGFTPDGNKVYVSLRDENRVAVIDRASRKVEGKIDVGPGPIQLVATPDGKQVYVANQGPEATPNDTVSVIDTTTGKVVKTLKTGLGAHGVSASADGAFVFVTNTADDSVSVIDARRQEVVGTVPVGDRPNGIVYESAN